MNPEEQNQVPLEVINVTDSAIDSESDGDDFEPDPNKMYFMTEEGNEPQEPVSVMPGQIRPGTPFPGTDELGST